MKALYEQMMDLYLIFQFLKGRCHGNQIMLQKRYQRRLIPLAFIALILENEWQYRGLAERSKSTNDASISCENFVKFGPVTSELTVLICERQVQHGQKNWLISSNISWYTGPIFTIFSPYESALRTDDGSVPYFPICQGMLPWQPNNFAVIKANWYYMHPLHVCQMVARFCLARGRHCGAERAIR